MPTTTATVALTMTSLLAFPEEPETVLGVRIDEILVDDHEIAVIAGRGLLAGTVFGHGGSTLGKGAMGCQPPPPRLTGLSPPEGG
jgi:hypothetical protein